MKTHPIFTQILLIFNQQFIKRLLSRWVIIFIILTLSTWLFFLQIDIQSLNSISWKHTDRFPGIAALIGLPAIFIASLIVALSHTRTDRKNNYPRIYWISYLIPTIILLGINCFSYLYYIHYTTERDIKRRQKLEETIKTNNYQDYIKLADMYDKGLGGPQDINKASELYKKACNEALIKTIAIQACKKSKNYNKLRMLLKDSNSPYDLITLSNLYETGLGGPQDLAKAKELYHKVCSEEESISCKKYKLFQ